MDFRYLAHIGADPDFYDDVWQIPERAEDVLGPSVAAADVRVSDVGPWRTHQTSRQLPLTGWKVHVSCLPSRAPHVVSVAVDAALGLGLSCKHLRTQHLVTSSQAKYAEPSSAGKVVTVYPTNDAELELVVRRLSSVLAGEAGARILSDIPVSGAPVSVRYGAFIGMHHVDDSGRSGVGLKGSDGSSAIDDRSAHSGNRAQHEVPKFVKELQIDAARRDATAVLPVRDVRVIHRSNAGGVYAATWSDGEAVVLKEARHNTGFDLAGADAVTRLRQERRALERLSGTGAAPEFVAYESVGDSEFLVMEFVEGFCAATSMATAHPGAVPGADSSKYRAWVETVIGGTRQALMALHSVGVTHLDVHPGNVIEREGSVVLIDLESCALDGVAVSRGVGTVLSACTDEVGPVADLVALTRMRALLLNPQFSLTAHRPDLTSELLSAGESDLADPASTSEQPYKIPMGASVDRIVKGLHVSAVPSRTDRLFPGDVAGLGVPGGGLGLLHGAGGVLQALVVTGQEVPELWKTWLVETSLGASYLAPGLADGAEGIAVCLARIGKTGAAREVMQRWGQRVSPAPWWARGTAGQALAHAELSLLLGEADFMVSALKLAHNCLQALEQEKPPVGYRAGLLDGWAGVGLALLRVAECLDASGPDTANDRCRLQRGACRAFELEMAAVHVVSDAWMTSDGNRLMPYLGTGSAALGILAAALLGIDHERGSNDDKPAWEGAVRGVLHALRLRAIGCSGLLHGRAGMLLALGCLAPNDAMVELHRRRLNWHTVPVTSTSRRDHRLAQEADLVLGDQNLRASADLGTGAAGVMMAVSADVDLAWAKAAGVLCFPKTSLRTLTSGVPRVLATVDR